MRYTERGLKKKLEEIRKDLQFHLQQKKDREQEIERLRIVLHFYEQKLRELRFKNPSSRVES